MLSFPTHLKRAAPSTPCPYIIFLKAPFLQSRHTVLLKTTSKLGGPGLMEGVLPSKEVPISFWELLNPKATAGSHLHHCLNNTFPNYVNTLKSLLSTRKGGSNPGEREWSLTSLLLVTQPNKGQK